MVDMKYHHSGEHLKRKNAVLFANKELVEKVCENPKYATEAIGIIKKSDFYNNLEGSIDKDRFFFNNGLEKSIFYFEKKGDIYIPGELRFPYHELATHLETITSHLSKKADFDYSIFGCSEIESYAIINSILKNGHSIKGIGFVKLTNSSSSS